MSTLPQTSGYRYAFKSFVFINFILSASCASAGDRHASCRTWPDNTTLPAVVSAASRKICTVHTGKVKSFNWTEAESYCSQHGGMLLVHDMKEKAHRDVFLKRYYPRDNNGIEISSCFWIGLRKNVSTGEWRYVDGSETNPRRRIMGEPIIGKKPSNANCSIICTAHTYLFLRDYDAILTTHCDKRLYAICQSELLRPEEQFETGSKRPRKPRVSKELVEPEDHPVIESRSPRKPRVSKANFIKELSCHKDLRLTTTPDCSVYAVTLSNCARMCLELLSECRAFNFNQKARRCNGFSSFIKVGVRESGWTLWKLMNR